MQNIEILIAGLKVSLPSFWLLHLNEKGQIPKDINNLTTYPTSRISRYSF
jgi:hypothetical protein